MRSSCTFLFCIREKNYSKRFHLQVQNEFSGKWSLKSAGVWFNGLQSRKHARVINIAKVCSGVSHLYASVGESLSRAIALNRFRGHYSPASVRVRPRREKMRKIFFWLLNFNWKVAWKKEWKLRSVTAQMRQSTFTVLPAFSGSYFEKLNIV